MNCPMCGAPMGDNDFECSKCFTKRSEMGPAYNNNGGYGGSSYGNGGYGNNSYGNNGYGNNNAYGNNTGYGDNNGYGNNGYTNNNNYGNGGFGSANNFGNSNGMGGAGNYNGLGYGAGGVGVRRSNSNKVIGLVIGVVVGLIAVFVIFIKPSLGGNKLKTFDMGDFKVDLPSNCVAASDAELDLSGMGDAKAYKNADMEFAYMHMDMETLGIDKSQMSLFQSLLMTQIDSTFSSMYDGYMNLGKTDDMVKFRFTNDDGKPAYVELKIICEDKGLYMVICICDGPDREKMQSRFDQVFDSITFK